MNLHTIHHVAIIASDYDKAKRFYVEALGFEVIREHHRPEKQDHKIDLRLGTYELELFIKPDSPERPNFPELAVFDTWRLKSTTSSPSSPN